MCYSLRERTKTGIRTKKDKDKDKNEKDGNIENKLCSLVE